MKNHWFMLCLAAISSQAIAADLQVGYTNQLGTSLFVNGAITGGGDFSATGAFPWAAVLTGKWTANQVVNITGIALPIHANSLGGTFTFSFYDIGPDNNFTGVANERLVGTATANYSDLNATSANWVVFDSPVNFVSTGTGVAIRITTSASTQVKIREAAATEAQRENATTGVAEGGTYPTFRISLAGTAAAAPDADSDGAPDAFETNTDVFVSITDRGTVPNDNDSDDDTLLDGSENNSGTFVSTANPGTNPNLADTDADGLNDNIENNTGSWVSASQTGTNPLDTDSDNDGLTDGREANPLAVGYTATDPLNRDHDGDRLGDKYEVDQGLNPLADADFDGDLFSDALEVLFYNSSPTNIASYPGDGISPLPGSFTSILSAGTVANIGDLNVPSTLGSAIVNEASQGYDDSVYWNGVTDFTVVYQTVLPAAGSTVSLTGFAWTVTSTNNAVGDILLQFYDPGTDGVFSGVDSETLVGTARGTLSTIGATSVRYWNFSTPVNFTSSGTALAVRIQSTAQLNIKGQDNVGTGFWHRDDNGAVIGNVRASRFSIGGTAVAPGLPEILSITRSGTSTDLTWSLGGAPNVTLQRSTTLNGFTDVPGKINTTDTTYSEVSSDPAAFFRLRTP